MDQAKDQQWDNYGRALIRSMSEVLAELAEEQHPVILETADYWLSLGLVIGLSRPKHAERLLALIESREDVGGELDADGESFCAEVLE